MEIYTNCYKVWLKMAIKIIKMGLKANQLRIKKIFALEVSYYTTLLYNMIHYETIILFEIIVERFSPPCSKIYLCIYYIVIY